MFSCFGLIIDDTATLLIFYKQNIYMLLMLFILSNIKLAWLYETKSGVPYFLDYSAPLFSSRPRIDRAGCPGLRVILRALE